MSDMRNIEAEEQYRSAWMNYVLTNDPVQLKSLENLMDSLQPSIADSPMDPRWGSFADSLPGYREYWGRLQIKFLDKHEQLMKINKVGHD